MSIDSCLDSLCGKVGDPHRARYAGDVSGESTQSSQIESVLRSLSFMDMTGAQRDHLHRILAGGIGAIREHNREIAGVKVKQWKPGPKQPATSKHYGFWEFDPHPWRDHPRREVNPEGRITYVAEPYHLNPEDILELTELIKEGWEVSVQAGLATHFPASTVAVRIRAKLKA